MRILSVLVLICTLGVAACSKSETNSSDGSGGGTASAQLNWDQGNWNQANWQ
ncbi:MAG TPA: hypothetical protein VFK92_06725 [Burkholderiales bacterium]|nr:hypothetical protein [Burkholderiales bacterium]